VLSYSEVGVGFGIWAELRGGRMVDSERLGKVFLPACDGDEGVVRTGWRWYPVLNDLDDTGEVSDTFGFGYLTASGAIYIFVVCTLQ